jgi:hypothetical protein
MPAMQICQSMGNFTVITGTRSKLVDPPPPGSWSRPNRGPVRLPSLQGVGGTRQADGAVARAIAPDNALH